jgi:hypothetical protein
MSEEKTKCHYCDNDADKQNGNGFLTCDSCWNNADDTGYCNCCDELFDMETGLRYSERTDQHICDHCFEYHGWFRCRMCDENCPDQDYYENDTCTSCYEQERPIMRTRNPNLKTKKYISKKAGTVIDSERPFGVEVEIINEDYENMAKVSDQMNADFGIVTDGSIEHHQGFEIVTPILAGKEGEQALRDAMDIVRKHGCDVNKSCGMHVHLDGEDFQASETIDKIRVKSLHEYLVEEEKAEKVENAMGLSADLYKELAGIVGNSQSNIRNFLKRQQKKAGSDTIFKIDDIGTIIARWTIFRSVPKTNDDPEHDVEQSYATEGYHFVIAPKGFMDEKKKKYKKLMSEDKISALFSFPMFISENSLKEIPISEEDILIIKCSDRKAFIKLKKLLYLYTTFSDVFLAMLPKSRRQNNGYCFKLGMGFSPFDVQSLTNIKELESLWYKTTKVMDIQRRKQGKYDQSRYYGVNLHSLFSKNGTIEIRYHSATTSIDKILMWVKIHQQILDNIEKIDENKLVKGADMFLLEDKIRFAFENFGWTDDVKDYMRKRIKHFVKLDV